MAAIRTDAVGKHRLVALATVLNLQRFDMLVASPLSLPGMRGSSFGNCHEFQPSRIAASKVYLPEPALTAVHTNLSRIRPPKFKGLKAGRQLHFPAGHPPWHHLRNATRSLTLKSAWVESLLYLKGRFSKAAVASFE
jgi:hypothetical protein